MKPTLANLRKLAALYSAEIDMDLPRINVDLTPGRLWRANGLHTLAANQYDGQPISEVYDDLIERMSMGVEETQCGHDCEWCYPDDPEERTHLK